MNAMLELSIELFELALVSSWVAVPVALFLLVVDWLVGNWIAARYRVVLWIVLFLRLLIPPETLAPESSFSVQHFWQLVSWVQIDATDLSPTHNASVGQTDTFTFDCDDGTTQTVTLPVATYNPTGRSRIHLPDIRLPDVHRAGIQDLHPHRLHAVDAAALRTPPPSSAGIVPFIGQALALLWLAVAVGIFFRSVVASWRFARNLAQVSEVQDQSMIDQLLRTCDSLQAGRRPRLKVVANINSPLIFGVWWPTLCLPKDQLEQLTPQQIEMIMLHEVSHVRRRDPILAWTITLFRALFWFNPFVWLAASRISHYAEQACDEMVVRQRPSERTDYADILIRFASQCRVPNLGLAGIWFGDRTRPMQRRIRKILSVENRASVGKTIGAFGVLTLAAAASLTEPATTTVSNDTTSNLLQRSPGITVTPAMRFGPVITPQQKLTVEEREYDLTDALRTIQEQKKCDAANAKEILETTLRGFLANFAQRDALDISASPVGDTARSGDTATILPDSHWELIDTTLKLRAAAPGHDLFELLRPELVGELWQVSLATTFITTSLEAANRSGIDWRQATLLQLDSANLGFPDVAAGNRLTGAELPEQTLNDAGVTDAKLSVKATTTIESFTPHMAILVNSDMLPSLFSSLQGDVVSELFSAPKVTAFNSQTVSIHDEVQRPFVVGLHQADQLASAHQPQIAVLPEGKRVVMRPQVLDDDQLELNCRITQSRIFDVDSIDLPGGRFVDGECVEGIILQSASVKNRKIDVSCRLDRKQALVVASPSKNEEGETILSLAVVTATWFKGDSIYDAKSGE